MYRTHTYDLSAEFSLRPAIFATRPLVQNVQAKIFSRNGRGGPNCLFPHFCISQKSCDLQQSISPTMMPMFQWRCASNATLDYIVCSLTALSVDCHVVFSLSLSFSSSEQGPHLDSTVRTFHSLLRRRWWVFHFVLLMFSFFPLLTIVIVFLFFRRLKRRFSRN